MIASRTCANGPLCGGGADLPGGGLTGWWPSLRDDRFESVTTRMLPLNAEHVAMEEAIRNQSGLAPIWSQDTLPARNPGVVNRGPMT